MSENIISEDIFKEEKPPLVKATVQLSKGKHEAFITLVPDKFGYAPSLELLKNALEKSSVKFGIDENALRTLATFPVYNHQTKVAEGTNSVQGKEASLRFFFERSVDYTPKMKEDGSVDFKDLGLIQAVRKGDLLVVKTPRTDGTNGTDVCGQPIYPTPARDYQIPVGRNVTLSPDKLKLFASMDGQVIYHNDRVSVLNTYNVDGDVSTATGNIEFNGNVIVKGNVQSGFRIKAAGDVEVGGIVEAAEIEAGGDIIIRNGFNGGINGKLTAEGMVMSKFIQAGSVVAGTKVETNYIYNSNVRSRDTINVVGKGIVVGGQMCARTRIDVGTLGNESSTKTFVEVGSDPEILKRNQELLAEIDTLKRNIAAIETALKAMIQLKKAGKLPPEKNEQLIKSAEMLKKLNEGMEGLLADKADLDEKLEAFGKGFIGVRNIAYPGVTIKMGMEVMVLKGKYQHTLFSRPEGDIRSGPL